MTTKAIYLAFQNQNGKAMRQILTISFLLIIGALTTSFSTVDSSVGKDDIVGKWYITDKSAIVQVYARGGKYYSKSFWSSEPNGPDGKPKRDIKNPDKNLRNRPVSEVEFLYDFKFDGSGKWYGEIYNVEDGRTYSGQIYLKGKNTLVLRGYIGSPILGRSVTWTRYEE